MTPRIPLLLLWFGYMEKTKYREDVKYFIEMVGMASGCIGGVTLDNKYSLLQIDPTYLFVLTPPIGREHP
jgi:uncharacterized membrane protein YoaK (UPF0700 family)